MSHNAFNTLDTFDLGNGKKGQFYSLPKLAQAGFSNPNVYLERFISRPRHVRSVCARSGLISKDDQQFVGTCWSVPFMR